MFARTRLTTGLILSVAVGLVTASAEAPRPDEATEIASGPYVDRFEDGDLDLGSEGRGVAFDALVDPAAFIAQNGRFRGPIPEPPVPVSAPEIVVSLAGLTCRVHDAESSWERVYPVGVGVRSAATGQSITPVGSFATHRDRGDGWFYIWERWVPSYFAGLPFLRIDAENDEGLNTYGLHGPITNPLKRGYVSHGCVRMRADDIKELFAISYAGPPAAVRIQEAWDRTRYGLLVDADYPRHHPASDRPEPVAVSGTTDVGVVLRLPERVEAGRSVPVEVEITGPDRAAVHSVLLNEGGRWDGQLAEPFPIHHTAPEIVLAAVGRAEVYAIALDRDERPVAYANRMVSIVERVVPGS